MFIESWILRASCKVSVKGFTYSARDPKYSWSREHSKNWINFLNEHVHLLCQLQYSFHQMNIKNKPLYKSGWIKIIFIIFQLKYTVNLVLVRTIKNNYFPLCTN